MSYYAIYFSIFLDYDFAVANGTKSLTHMKLEALELIKKVVNISAFLELAGILYLVKDYSIMALLGNSKYLKTSQGSVLSQYDSFCVCYLLRTGDSLLVKTSYIPFSPRLKTSGFSL